MSVLAIRNVPLKFKAFNMTKILSKVIRGSYEIINFAFAPKRPGQKFANNFKLLYIRLGPSVDPLRVIEAIGSRTTFSAYIPKVVPKLTPIKNEKIQKHNKSMTPITLLLTTHEEILTEMQSKFTGLYNLAKKTNFELMNKIAWTVFERLKKLAETSPEMLSNGFKASGAYRKTYPHFGDFQLILSTLHALQDAAGAPRAHIVESELCKVSAQPFVVENVPMDKAQGLCTKYSDRIAKKITEHIEKLEVESSTDNAEEDEARKKVRAQLKKMNTLMPKIVREVILNHFIPQKAPYHKVRIYGEPFLPNREQMASLTKRCAAVAVQRSDRMYNLLKLSIPLLQYQSLFSQNGTTLGGAKLHIRSSQMPLYHMPKSLKKEIKRALGVEDEESDDAMEAEEEEVVDGEGEVEMVE